GHDRSDKNSYVQRERNKQTRNRLFLTRPGDHSAYWFIHFNCTCILSAAISRGPHYSLIIITPETSRSCPTQELRWKTHWPFGRGGIGGSKKLISSLPLTHQPCKLLSRHAALQKHY